MIDNLKDNKKIKILAYVHGYLPNHVAGSEVMLHKILLNLKDKGFDVRVLTNNPGAKEHEGILIEHIRSDKATKWIFDSDIVFTHHHFSRSAIALAKKLSKPVVLLIHNDPRTRMNKLPNFSLVDLVVSNSLWVKKLVRKAKDSMIVYPPTDPDTYFVNKTGDAITLINMNEDKGGKIFWELARILKDKKFIGVEGSYGHQVIYKEKLSNVTILKKTLNIKTVYEQSKIIIMPSSHESWGMVAMEAACSGIPTIASTAEGLKESLGPAGIFADLNSIADWIEKIRMLDDKKTYEKYSVLGKTRSVEVFKEFNDQMLDLESRLVKLVHKD
jgi:glycosyltransferase involved in cell wall biosynthesis